jgi:hypothetical protein
MSELGATHPELSVIIVSWNVSDLLQQALRSLYEHWENHETLEVIVVDNASTDDTVQQVADHAPEATLIVNHENRGFTASNNQGLEAARGDFLLLLNPDTEIRGDALRTMVDTMRRHSEVGLLGPKLLNADGTVQSSRRRFPTLPILFLESTWLQSITPRSMLVHYYMKDQPDTDYHQVDWVTGAAMLTRREVVQDVGGLDEGFFMYSEELDWCRRIREAGWSIAYTPAAEIVHYGGKSSEQVAPARHIYFQASKIRYARKYHGALIAHLLRGSLMAQYVWQMGVEALKWLVGHRRPLRARRIAAYRDVLRSRLKQPHRSS